MVQGCLEDPAMMRRDSPSDSRDSFFLVLSCAAQEHWSCSSADAASAYLQAGGIERLLLIKSQDDSHHQDVSPEKCVWLGGVFTELGTKAVPGINTTETNLRRNFVCMRVLWKRDSIFMRTMAGSLLSQSPMSTICSTHMTRVAQPLKHCWRPL